MGKSFHIYISLAIMYIYVGCGDKVHFVRPPCVRSCYEQIAVSTNGRHGVRSHEGHSVVHCDEIALRVRPCYEQ